MAESLPISCSGACRCCRCWRAASSRSCRTPAAGSLRNSRSAPCSFPACWRWARWSACWPREQCESPRRSPGSPSAMSRLKVGLLLDPLSAAHGGDGHLRRALDLHLQPRLHGEGKALRPLLRIPLLVLRRDADGGAFQQPAAALHGVGTGGPRVLSAHRILF